MLYKPKGAPYFRLKYEGLEGDPEFVEVDLQNSTKVEDTINRLRHMSMILQDHDYHTVRPKMVVCAAHKKFKENGEVDERKHFDAKIVDKVFFYFILLNFAKYKHVLD